MSLKYKQFFYKSIYFKFEKEQFLPFTPCSNQVSGRYWCCHLLEDVLFGAFSKFTASPLTQSVLCAQTKEYVC